MMQKLSENVLDKFSMDFLRNQVLKNAYGNDDTVIARLDPRILLAWYVFFALAPWFVDNLVFLLGCFLLVAVTTIMARVAGLVLFLFLLGVFSQTGYLFVVSLLFGGNAETILPLLILTLKVATVSLASITVFSGLDPDRLSNGLMWYGCPERLSFSISYAYRMLPMLMEEFQNVLLSYRLRGNAPNTETLTGKIRYLVYQIKMIIHSFYPLMLNTAKRSRTTVEALEIKGYRYGAVNKEVKKMKLSALKVTYNDLLFLFALGVFSQTGYLFLVTLLFGGDASAIAPLLVLTLKVATISLASVTVFSGLDPDRLSNGLMWFGCPERLSFSISYAYRMLPMLMEEFQNVLLSYRLRGNPPAHDTFMGKVRYLVYQVKIVMESFYPLMLNTAKRSRTTVEALELRGYRYAAINKTVKKMKLAALKVTYNDLLFLAISFLCVAVSVLISTLF